MVGERTRQVTASKRLTSSSINMHTEHGRSVSANLSSVIANALRAELRASRGFPLLINLRPSEFDQLVRVSPRRRNESATARESSNHKVGVCDILDIYCCFMGITILTIRCIPLASSTCDETEIWEVEILQITTTVTNSGHGKDRRAVGLARTNLYTSSTATCTV
ncbi:hypothetical protein BDY19DRAFT_475008 [Irpex rosettiformis]|uniref:Uncharacterized protein n=1 Tax=Irpex rosettiformis TaxID=378272 RepID=A0ACB8TSA6_9APHY|nr:hypothetical protein BDY19DRAFT_475008 [Irpex rosettiformis]